MRTFSIVCFIQLTFTVYVSLVAYRCFLPKGNLGLYSFCQLFNQSFCQEICFPHLFFFHCLQIFIRYLVYCLIITIYRSSWNFLFWSIDFFMSYDFWVLVINADSFFRIFLFNKYSIKFAFCSLPQIFLLGGDLILSCNTLRMLVI